MATLRRNASSVAKQSADGMASAVASISGRPQALGLRLPLPESAAGLRPRPEDLAKAERVAE